MTDFWVSTKKYFCEICRIWVADNKPVFFPHLFNMLKSRFRHDTSDKHNEKKNDILKHGGKRGNRNQYQFVNPAKQAAALEFQRIEKASFYYIKIQGD
jgi:hypothetical protein